MAQRLQRTTIEPNDPTTAAAGESPVKSAPLTPTEQDRHTDAMNKPEDKKVDNPVVNEKKPVDNGPTIVGNAQAELDTLIAKMEALVNSLKGQKTMTAESGDLFKLSCAKLLREVTYKLTEVGETVDKMKTLTESLKAQQKSLETARDYLNEKSATFRTERDAFVKLRSLSEKEFYASLNSMIEKTNA